MVRLHTVNKVRIAVYANDHLPPHFHLTGVEREALVEIATFQVIAGTVPSGEAMDWAACNIDAIRDAWNQLNPRFPIA